MFASRLLGHGHRQTLREFLPQGGSFLKSHLNVTGLKKLRQTFKNVIELYSFPEGRTLPNLMILVSNSQTWASYSQSINREIFNLLLGNWKTSMSYSCWGLALHEEAKPPDRQQQGEPPSAANPTAPTGPATRSSTALHNRYQSVRAQATAGPLKKTQSPELFWRCQNVCTRWCPLVINWFINPINYRYTSYKPQLLEL